MALSRVPWTLVLALTLLPAVARGVDQEDFFYELAANGHLQRTDLQAMRCSLEQHRGHGGFFVDIFHIRQCEEVVPFYFSIEDPDLEALGIFARSGGIFPGTGAGLVGGYGHVREWRGGKVTGGLAIFHGNMEHGVRAMREFIGLIGFGDSRSTWGGSCFGSYEFCDGCGRRTLVGVELGGSIATVRGARGCFDEMTYEIHGGEAQTVDYDIPSLHGAELTLAIGATKHLLSWGSLQIGPWGQLEYSHARRNRYRAHYLEKEFLENGEYQYLEWAQVDCARESLSQITAAAGIGWEMALPVGPAEESFTCSGHIGVQFFPLQRRRGGSAALWYRDLWHEDNDAGGMWENFVQMPILCARFLMPYEAEFFHHRSSRAAPVFSIGFHGGLAHGWQLDGRWDRSGLGKRSCSVLLLSLGHMF
ncbi:MAG: hypothetical protein LBT98_04565 [Puniceicoccales bacterium]|jgi:hypothetical protein|nr:hypothetical protein [Puniceicoccales bacterium]